jgi:hypothetical protein
MSLASLSTYLPVCPCVDKGYRAIQQLGLADHRLCHAVPVEADTEVDVPV